jgi:hypothetical protein
MRKPLHRIEYTGSCQSLIRSLDAEDLRTQVEVIRDVMLSASDCNTWLTLHEIAEMTRFGEASISAQLRHLRKPAFGGYRVDKRRRIGAGEMIVSRAERKWSGGATAASASIATRAGARSRGPARRAYGRRPSGWEYRVVR